MDHAYSCTLYLLVQTDLHNDWLRSYLDITVIHLFSFVCQNLVASLKLKTARNQNLW